MNTTKKLYRSRTDRVILGVCGGLGEYFGIDSLIIRLIFVALLFSGAGLLIYFIFIILVPSEDKKIDNFVKDSTKTANISDWRFIFGIIIIIIGVFMLASNCFPDGMALFKNIWRNFWPIVLIILGGMILLKKNNDKK
jgi:phage shock protein PspC (stress-responsive transcriptional regulator)